MEVEHFKPSKKYDYVPPKLCTLADGDLTIESDRGNVPLWCHPRWAAGIFPAVMFD
jgi:hypothetical protein